MAPVSVPIASRLPSALRLPPTNATVTRVLGRLSRPALLALALDWLDDGNQTLTAPYLRRRGRDDDDDDDDDFYPPAASLDALREHYADLQSRKGSKRQVLDRILEGDWRHGLSLYQLAMADLQHLYDHPASQKWTAFQIVPLTAAADGDGGGGDGDAAAVSAVVDKASLVVPRFHPSSFLRNLQAQILPDIKVHYNFDRHRHLPLLLLRLFILDSPYNTSLAAVTATTGTDTTDDAAAATAAAARLAHVEASRTVYLAFPDASPFVYLSSTQSASAPAGEPTPGSAATAAAMASLRSLVVEAVPKALSQAHARYALRPTHLATRNLAALLQRRGAGRTNTAGGGWGIYADATTTIESPLSTRLPATGAARLDGTAGRDARRPAATKRAASPPPPPPLSGPARRQQQAKRRRRQVAAGRFGLSAKMGDGVGVERVDIVLQDPFPGGRRPLDRAADRGAPLAAAAAAAADADADADADTDTASAPAPAPAPADRRRSRGGRRSQIDAVLARDEEEAEEEEARARHAATGTAGEEEDDDEGDAAAAGGDATWRPRVAFTFHGHHVFAGVRQLVEAGVIDGETMPGWLTGEEGVTVGAVRHGRIRGHKGSGMP